MQGMLFPWGHHEEYTRQWARLIPNDQIQELVNRRMSLFLDSWFCSIGLEYDSAKLFWFLQLCSKFWNKELRVLQLCSVSVLFWKLWCIRVIFIVFLVCNSLSSLDSKIWLVGAPERKKMRRKEITNEISQEVAPELKDMILQIERAHQVPSTMDGAQGCHGEMLNHSG